MMRKTMLLATAASCLCAVPAYADDSGAVFDLGEVTTTAPASGGTESGGATVTQDDMREFHRDTLDQAVQLVPGTSLSAVGARNETDIWIRGFDRWRLRLSQDGIPIYLPADNRIDFSQFTTGDIGEIQVTKGFTSVIDGPGAMGGSVNLVSRQVTKPFEADVRVGSSFDSDGAFNGFVSDAFAGSRQQNWYFQGAVSENYQNHYRLADGFQPGTFENGGNRDNSYHQDYKLNFKVGYVPDALDEYSLNVISQIGHKDNPLPDTLVPASGPNAPKDWTWPAWDKQSLYWLSNTALDEIGSYVKVRAYGDRFYNALSSFDNANFSSQSSPKSFDSRYNDYALGGNVEYSQMLLGGQDDVKTALHYRWDQHNAWEATNAQSGGPWYSQPWLRDEENTYSAAIENTYHPLRTWDVITGVSYDYRQMLQAEDWETYSSVPSSGPYGYILHYPVSDNHAVNPELAVVYHYSASGAAHASVSERTRFPTLFEMFSSRFGTVVGNAYLQPEKSDNVETGISQQFGDSKVGVNLFHSRIMSAIDQVPVTIAGYGTTTQNQNVGTEEHDGFELEGKTMLSRTLILGGNYSYLERQITNHVAVATDTPKHKLFAYLNWMPIAELSVVPSVELDSKRWMTSAANSYYYLRSGDCALANLKVSYQLNDSLSIDVGANNLFDENYVVEDGYNAEGRNFYTDLRMKF